MIGTVKDVANIAFFLAVAVVTILSYLHARRTLFAPIRVETFKFQLQAFQEVLLFFQNKSESDFLTCFDLQRIVDLNASRMAGHYVDLFFPDEIKIDKEAREKAFAAVVVGGVASIEYFAKHMERVDAETPRAPAPAEEARIRNPAIVLARWQKYEHGMIDYTREFVDQCKELDRLAASPLLPTPLREQLQEFGKIAHGSVTTIGAVLTACARKMPDHYPNAADMFEFSSEWVWNEYNDRRTQFEPAAKKILDYINSYLNVETLLQ